MRDVDVEITVIAFVWLRQLLAEAASVLSSKKIQ